MRTGDIAPDFRLPDHEGNIRSLGDMVADGPVVLFFYPAASSPVCTAQACHFRDLGASFAALGAQRVGISTDTADRQSHFAMQRAFDYPLLSDSDATVAEQFGVRRGNWMTRFRRRRDLERRRSHAAKRGIVRRLLSVKRTTFVIDRHRVVRLKVTSERAHVHANRALDFLRYLA
ncbi:peroxiredoxin [Rhodococcoides yunnanense]|jgi:peroxiredoxin Q/BCP|uniref:peroxiredoxin n=1 Tax=Rhodococcoides yunnanense TaxID=278209 RepID=UPI0022B0EDD0|nr:peroxiredoxin [Rhodococcus yunnanensis]MCZ4277033.1 peroxiredoxin [Rhodococcus yunnanensis]